MNERRTDIATVVDFGAGDGRFAKGGRFKSYTGYEIDRTRIKATGMSRRCRIIHECAFSADVPKASLCIGNPPFVRNQDLPEGWRFKASKVIELKTGLQISGLANAWQYFAFLALASTCPDGLVALVLPFEWVSRPSASRLREFIRSNKWEVDAYRLSDSTFSHVLTTSSISIIDKSKTSGRWRFFDEKPSGMFQEIQSPTGSLQGFVAYSRNVRVRESDATLKRGLSPGTQTVLTLTEYERLQHKLRIGRDVVRCVTTLKPIRENWSSLTKKRFKRLYQGGGEKCWLPQTGGKLSKELRAYFDQVPKADRNTATCKLRTEWWRFSMPQVPSVLVSSGFRGSRPKSVKNTAGVVAVGGVTGVYGLSERESVSFVSFISGLDLSNQVVAHAKGMLKVEIGQLRTLVDVWRNPTK